ncbi:MAG: hypothetical protein H6825_01495 [Planctomycetes bacterium]|nr:hypothetical protein [Planctomycetota bacterium]
MTFAARFEDDEWTRLCFAVLDTYWLAASIDGRIDALEEAELAEELSHPQLAESPLMAEVLSSMAPRFPALAAAYRPATRGPAEHERAFREISRLLDERVDPETAAGFKSALIDLGMNVANASGLPVPGRGRVSDVEIAMLAAISEWLGLEDA